MAVPSNQLPVGEGLGPAGEPGASFFIDLDELRLIEEDGPEWKYEDARFIHEAVSLPDAIFAGLKRPGQRESSCYSERVTHDPDEQAPGGLPRYGQVFLAYVRAEVGFIVFDWEWREEDPEEPGHPLGWGVALARRTWRRT